MNRISTVIVVATAVSFVSGCTFGVELAHEDRDRADKVSTELEILGKKLDYLLELAGSKADRIADELATLNSSIKQSSPKLEEKFDELNKSVQEMWNFLKSFDTSTTRAMFGAKPRK